MAARAPGVVWRTDDQPGSGNWRDCGVYLSGRLELHFNDSSLPRLYEWINGVRYAFDFASMTQTNTGTSFQRALRRRPSSGGGASSSGGATSWEYEDGRPNSGDWRPCDAATSAFLAARLASGVSGPSAPRVIRGAQYTFDTQNFLQTNISTGFTRTIRPAGGASAAQPAPRPAKRARTAALPPPPPLPPPRARRRASRGRAAGRRRDGGNTKTAGRTRKTGATSTPRRRRPCRRSGKGRPECCDSQSTTRSTADVQA